MANTTPGSRRPSARCKSFIKMKEQCRLEAYMPTPNDKPTIGWGATGPDVRMGMVWTQAKADERFERDLAMFAAAVDHMIGSAPTSQDQFDALVSFAYNVGLDEDADQIAEGLGDSTLLMLHKMGAFERAAAQFERWNKQKGKVLRGLTLRRREEAAMYRGVYP